MRAVHTLLILAAASLLTPFPALADEVKCDEAKTIQDCFNTFVFNPDRALEGGQQAKAAEVKGDAEAEAQEKNQSGAAAGGGQARSTITDLLPWLDVLGMVSDSDASDGTVALDLNFLLPIQDRDNVNRNSQLKWAFDVSPEPFEPLISALPEDVQEERKKELQDQIDDTADSELQYTFSVVTEKLGRDFRRQSGRLSALLAPVFVAASQGDIDDEVDSAKARFGGGVRALVKTMRTSGVDAAGFMGNPISSFTREDRERINRFVNESRSDLSVAMAKKLTAIGQAAISSKADTLAQLVLLQPQLTFSATKSIRNELVGPESMGFKVSYERSFVSLNDFIKESDGACSMLEKFNAKKTMVKLGEANACLDSLARYMDVHAEDIDDESRIVGSVEYKKVDRWQYAIPSDAVELDIPKYDRIVGSVGYGRAIRRSDVKDRVDFEASYDSNLDSDDTYKSRFVVTLTYTRRFRDMDLPFSIVYANKSEFIEGVDKQIGLHFGVKFRALDKE